MKEKITFKLTKREIQLIRYIRDLGFGRLEIIVHAGESQKIIRKEREVILNGNISIKTFPLDRGS